MFFRKKRNEDDEDDSQFGELDVLVVGRRQSPIADGIRDRALERDDITPEDRRELQAALKRIKDQAPPSNDLHRVTLSLSKGGRSL